MQHGLLHCRMAMTEKKWTVAQETVDHGPTVDINHPRTLAAAKVERIRHEMPKVSGRSTCKYLPGARGLSC